MYLENKVRNKLFIYFLILVITLGIVFRFNNFALKPLWLDEGFTILRASGHSYNKEGNQFYNPVQITTANEILKLQRIDNPDAKISDTISGLALEEPQHPPFYFLINRFWGQVFGFDTFSMRLLPVICGMLGIPALYWLCRELSTSPLMALLAVSFYSVSPIFIRYSQEIRQYSLLLSLAILSSASLLKAIRKPTFANWSIYSLLTSLSFYTQPISILTAFGQAIYFVLFQKFKLNRNIIFFTISGSLATLIFLPWLLIINNNYGAVSGTTSWMGKQTAFSEIYKYWSVGLSRTFLGLHFNDYEFAYILAPILFSVILFLFYYLIRFGYRELGVFVVSLSGASFLPFLIKDLMDSGVRTTKPRFFLPCYLGIYLALSFFLTHKIQFGKRKAFWSSATSLILIITLTFSGLNTQAITWWGWSEHDAVFSRMIKQAENPLVISNQPMNQLVPFAHQLLPHTKMLVIKKTNSLDSFTIPDNFSDIFLYLPSKELIETLKAKNAEIKLLSSITDPLSGHSFRLFKYFQKTDK